MKEFLTFMSRDLDRGWGHIAYRCVSLINLYVLPNFNRNGKTFSIWMEWMDARTGCIRSTRRSQSKKRS